MTTIELTWPIRDWPNPNRDRKKHWTKERAEARAIRSAAATLGRASGIQIPGPVNVDLEWTFPDARERDTENFSTKALIDGLVDSGLIAGDSNRVIKHIGKETNEDARSPKGHLRVTVTITERPPDKDGPQRAATRAGLTTQSET